MTAATHSNEPTGSLSALHLALELGKAYWKLGFTTGLGQVPRYRTISLGNLESLEEGIERARARFDLPNEIPVISCYEAGRDGLVVDQTLDIHHIVLADG